MFVIEIFEKIIYLCYELLLEKLFWRGCGEHLHLWILSDFILAISI